MLTIKMLTFLTPEYAACAFYLNLFEAFAILLLSSGTLLAGLFLIHESDQNSFAAKYIEIGKGFAVLFVGFSIPMSIMQGTLMQIANQPKVAQACTTISVPRNTRK